MVVKTDSKGNSDVFSADGRWLGWVNAAGEGMSMAGFDPALRTAVVDAALAARKAVA